MAGTRPSHLSASVTPYQADRPCKQNHPYTVIYSEYVDKKHESIASVLFELCIFAATEDLAERKLQKPRHKALEALKAYMNTPKW